jgi:mono/diheme cytochrome c family protein
MKESRMRWTAMLALVFALGLTACGGDANGSDADQAVADAKEAMAEAGETVSGAMDDAREAVEDAGDAVSEAVDAIKQEMPEGVTKEMIAKGKGIYMGAGICSSCHGPAGKGIPSLGANLTDDEWLHSDGSYDGIVKTVMEGVTAQESSSGVPMPAKAGTNISDDDVKAVAAYVWTLSR